MVASPKDLRPSFHGDLAGEEDGLAGMVGLDDLEQLAAVLSGEALKGSVVEEEQVDLGEAFHKALGGALVAGVGQRGDRFGDAAVKDGPPLAAGLVGERAGNEGLSGAGRAVDDQVEGLAASVAGGELGEGCAGDGAPCAAVDVLDIGADAQLGLAQMTEIALAVAVWRSYRPRP